MRIYSWPILDAEEEVQYVCEDVKGMQLQSIPFKGNIFLD